jgi:hypothetical protein
MFPFAAGGRSSPRRRKVPPVSASPRERFLAALRGRPVDRVPLDLEGLHFATREQVEALEDPGRRELAERVVPHTAYPVYAPGGMNRWLMTLPEHMQSVSEQRADGTTITTRTIKTPKGPLTGIVGRHPSIRTTWTVKYPCQSLEDIEKIRSVPWHVPEQAAPPDLSDLPEDFPRRRYVRSGVSSPFVCVAGMMPYEYFLELCATHLDLLRELTQMCLERTLAILDAVLAEGTVEYVWMGGCEWLTPPMGSPALYDALVQQYERPVIERIHAGGALAHVHCHGNVRSTLERVIERGADLLEPVEPPPDGDIEFAEAKRLAGGRITLGGNVEARVLECGTVDQTEAAVRAAFDGGKQRMVLRTTAGPVGEFHPPIVRNYHRMIDLWEELSEV